MVYVEVQVKKSKGTCRIWAWTSLLDGLSSLSVPEAQPRALFVEVSISYHRSPNRPYDHRDRQIGGGTLSPIAGSVH